MDFITVPAVMLIICFFVYKLFELYACRKERLYILEHLKERNFNDMKFPSFNPLGVNISFSALKWGCFLFGIGFGILLANFICIFEAGFDIYRGNWYSNPFQIVFGGSTALCGGLGLIIASVLEMNNKKKSDN